jgi:hypothetical protein
MEVLADTTAACPANCPATTLQIWGAIAFGALLGWYVYFINRYRKSDVQLGDLVTLLGVIGGGAVLTLFPARSDLFGAYGIGLFVGFFLYFIVLLVLVGISKKFTVDWFLDGRRGIIGPGEMVGTETRPTTGAMIAEGKGPQ